jgi:hypothetical protein
MELKFNLIYEQILEKLLCEGIDRSFLRTKNAEAAAYKKELKSPQAKQRFKTLSKDLIIHFLNGNYKNILSKYFPNLVPFSNKTSDHNFKIKLNEELASTMMTAETYKSLLKDIDDIIYELSRRNNNELGYLLLLRANYLLGY